jgi:hypothetical protein
VEVFLLGNLPLLAQSERKPAKQTRYKNTIKPIKDNYYITNNLRKEGKNKRE